MTAIAERARREYANTMESPTRLSLFLIAILLTFTVGLAVFLRAIPPSVAYSTNGEVTVIEPIEQEVCAGGVVHFPNVVFVKGGEISSVSFADAWCLAGLEGSCVSVVPRPDMPLLEPKAITSTRSTLNVPSTLKPGVLHFQHVATVTDFSQDGTGVTTGAAAYIVAPINVVECEEPTPTSP